MKGNQEKRLRCADNIVADVSLAPPVGGFVTTLTYSNVTGSLEKQKVYESLHMTATNPHASALYFVTKFGLQLWSTGEPHIQSLFLQSKCCVMLI